MPNASINRGNVHPLADSALREYPLSDHAFNPNPCNGEICRDCGRMRALHVESDTVNPAKEFLKDPDAVGNVC